MPSSSLLVQKTQLRIRLKLELLTSPPELNIQLETQLKYLNFNQVKKTTQKRKKKTPSISFAVKLFSPVSKGV